MKPVMKFTAFLIACLMSSFSEVKDIPPFVAVNDANWYEEFLCEVNGRRYALAYDDAGHQSVVIYDNEHIIVDNPALRVEKLDDGDYRFHVSAVGKSMEVDFSDEQSIKRLSDNFSRLPSYSLYKKEVLCKQEPHARFVFIASMPTENNPYFYDIKSWLINGDVEEEAGVYRFADEYQKSIKDYLDEDDDVNEYSGAYYHLLRLDAVVDNSRWVTFQRYVYDYSGGAHGSYMEELITYDLVHHHEINWSYLFSSEYNKEVMDVFYRAAKENRFFMAWSNAEDEDALRGYFDDENEPKLQSLGLSSEGVVISYPLYSIAPYAAGVLYFVLPFKEIYPYLTARGKELIGQ